MIKYPLSKEPIYADKSANLLKNVTQKILSALDDLNDAIKCIQTNLIGEEFNAACEYIEKIKLDIINSNNNDVNLILSKLTLLINNYNSDIVDAEGKPYKCKVVNYGASSISDNEVMTSGGVISSGVGIKDNSENKEENKPSNSEKNDDQNSSVNNNKPINENYNTSQQSLDSIINYSLANRMALSADNTFFYNDVEYKWSEVVKQFLIKEQLNNVISDITIKDGIIKCFMQNGQSFVIDNVSNYTDLKSAIMACLNELVY